MMIDRDMMADIKNELDDRYVLRSNCNDIQDKVNKKFSNDDKRIEIISHDFKTIKWLVSTVAASSIGALIVSIFDILLK